jgi:hypothetical protein
VNFGAAPTELVRWYRTDNWFTDGKRILVWEYPRQAPDGDQIELMEVMEIEHWSEPASSHLLGLVLRQPAHGERGTQGCSNGVALVLVYGAASLKKKRRNLGLIRWRLTRGGHAPRR